MCIGTDSFLYHITVPDVYEAMKNDLDKFDISDYPADNVYGMSRVNKEVLELMNESNEALHESSDKQRVDEQGVDGCCWLMMPASEPLMGGF